MSSKSVSTVAPARVSNSPAFLADVIKRASFIMANPQASACDTFHGVKLADVVLASTAKSDGAQYRTVQSPRSIARVFHSIVRSPNAQKIVVNDKPALHAVTDTREYFVFTA
jgi:hypothetical protein